MKAENSVSRLLIMISFSLPMICCYNSKENSEITKVLILSGKNNHEWQKTTPLIVKELKQSGLFETDVTNKPDTLSYESLTKYDVVLSNWNTWPDNDIRMSSQWESDFLRYIREGGGFVSVHAGSSLFYKWEEFHKIGIGRWGKETSHGQVIKGRIGGLDKSHPVTKGIRDFYIADEFWEKTEIHHGAKAIGSAIVSGGTEGHSINEPVLFYDHFSKGRSFFIALGHDERAINNTGFRTLLLRATQWAAHRTVSADVPLWLKETSAYSAGTLNWRQTDSTVCLMNKSGIIWQFNFNDRYGKPYFHPVATGNSLLTCVSPEDHPWHLGLWFSWKFINGINYWEYIDNKTSETKRYGSEGLTETEKVDIQNNGDFSSDILMNLSYRPAKGTAVLSESRGIHISPPYSDGSYYMDFETVFQPVDNDVILDRTPVAGEPDGKSWGGYAGLSIRFNQDFTSPETISQEVNDNSKNSKWLYMGFSTLTGDTAGMCIFQDPGYSTHETRWYIINDSLIPFFYYSPAILYDGPILLKKGGTLHLRYRIWILPGTYDRAEIESKYVKYLQET